MTTKTFFKSEIEINEAGYQFRSALAEAVYPVLAKYISEGYQLHEIQSLLFQETAYMMTLERLKRKRNKKEEVTCQHHS